MEQILIDVGTCAQIVTDTVLENTIALAIVAGILFAAFIIFFALYLFQSKELSLAKDYLRRRNGLNDYETWKKDREVKV